MFLQSNLSSKYYTISEGGSRDRMRQVYKEPNTVPDIEQVSSFSMGLGSSEAPAEECSYWNSPDPTTVLIYFRRVSHCNQAHALRRTYIEGEKSQSWRYLCLSVPVILRQTPRAECSQPCFPKPTFGIAHSYFPKPPLPSRSSLDSSAEYIRSFAISPCFLI